MVVRSCHFRNRFLAFFWPGVRQAGNKTPFSELLFGKSNFIAPKNHFLGIKKLFSVLGQVVLGFLMFFIVPMETKVSGLFEHWTITWLAHLQGSGLVAY